MRFRSSEVRKNPQVREIKLFPESAFDAVKDGVTILDEKGTHIYVNPAFCRMTGFTENELIGFGPPYPYWAEENQTLIMSKLSEGFKGKLKDVELTFKAKDEKRFSVTVNTSEISDEDNPSPYYLTTVACSETEPVNLHKNKVLKKFKHSDHGYQSLVENSFLGFFIVDIHSGHIQFLNKSLCNFFGYSLDEGLNLSVWDLISPEEHEPLEKTLKKWPLEYETKPTKSGVYTGVRKDGTIIRIAINATIIEYDGTLLMQGIVNDVTKEEGLEERLRQAQKMEAIGTLAGGISHDFNNILSAIIGYSELANFKLHGDNPAEESINEILKASYRAKDLVAQILAFSRKDENELKPVCVKSIIKEVLKLIKASLPSTIEIKQNLRQDIGVIMGDPTRIHQIMMNLCTNSAHAMSEEGGVLEVSLYGIYFDENVTVPHPDIKPGRHVVISVRDTGHGIPPDIINRIFDPYYTTKEKGVGTGMGLAVVHGIVKNCKGAINVYSEPGKGTTFKIYLPEVEKQQIPELSSGEHNIPLGNEKILFIDDEETLAALGKNILETLGYRVTMISSSREAFKLFNSDPEYFDLVITDMTMPGLTGTKLTKNIRDVRPETPVILCTGYNENINEEKSKKMGINAFIMKPLTMLDLAMTVRDVLDRRN